MSAILFDMRCDMVVMIHCRGRQDAERLIRGSNVEK
jgi:hypothetical protein